MSNSSRSVPTPASRTALLIMATDSEPILCPFFTNCDGVLIVDPESKRREFHHNGAGSIDHLCSIVVDAKAERLVCGFIGKEATKKLRAAGIDVRLGSCSCAIDDLVADFDALPIA